MTPRIAFAIALAFACGAASSDEAVNQGLASITPPNPRSPPAAAMDAAWQIDPDGVLPVFELAAPTQLPETIDLTAQPEELFQRLRLGFSMPNINNSLVLHHQQWYLNHPESLRRMVERSSRYLHHIVEELEKRGMPMELALLPMVESAYNPTAYSRSHASGLWQFVPATGKQYKLEQNWWVDERRDIVASTAAALDYLQYIYDLHGDWHLALASYNWGEGAVGKAINRNKANGLPSDYLSLTMPEETRHYVPKLQALKNVFSNPNILAKLNVRGVPNRPYFATVTKTGNIDVKLAAQLAEMPVQDFVALNPAHNRPVIKSETPMVIPTDKVNTFISNLEAHEGNEKPLSSWQAYTLRAGDRLEEVAPRFGMTVANLKSVNGINGRIKLAPGLTLLVAAQEGADPADVVAFPETQVLAEQPRLPQPEPAPVAVTRSHTVLRGEPVVATRSHTVRKGETLSEIASHYDMSVAELKQINKLRANQVNTGTRLAVATPEPAGKPQGAAQRTAALLESESRFAPARSELARTHTVRKGETLAQVASHYGMTVTELKQINKLRADQVNAGSKLTLAAPEPASRLPASRSRTEVAEVESRQTLARADTRKKADDSSDHSRQMGKKSAKLAQYTIRRGDTLGSIARQFRVDKDDLLRWNRIHGNELKPGQTLTIQLVQNML